jgi:hypothetical protein
MKNPDALQARQALHLHGLLAHWRGALAAGWPAALIDCEDAELARRSSSVAFRVPISAASSRYATSIGLGPLRSTGERFEALMTLDFLKDATTNAVLVRPNGVGKSTLARNLAHEAVIHSHTVLFTNAGRLLGELASLDGDSALRQRLRYYVASTLLLIDEVAYLSYSNRHADLMVELISRRYEQKSTVVTTNRAFAKWREVFPNAACVVSMVDRLMHNAEAVSIEGESYRAKEAKERAERTTKQRRGGKSRPNRRGVNHPGVPARSARSRLGMAVCRPPYPSPSNPLVTRGSARHLRVHRRNA